MVGMGHAEWEEGCVSEVSTKVTKREFISEQFAIEVRSQWQFG